MVDHIFQSASSLHWIITFDICDGSYDDAEFVVEGLISAELDVLVCMRGLSVDRERSLTFIVWWLVSASSMGIFLSLISS